MAGTAAAWSPVTAASRAWRGHHRGCAACKAVVAADYQGEPCEAGGELLERLRGLNAQAREQIS